MQQSSLRAHRSAVVYPPPRRLMRSAVAALALYAGVLHGAQAVTTKVYCIGDSFQLGDVLATGNEGYSTNLDIRLRQGTYTIGSTDYQFIAPTTLRGGYTDATCTARNPNPYNTVVDLSGGSLSLTQPKGPSRASLTVDGLTFRHGTSVYFGAGTTNAISNDDGDLTVRRTRFTDLTGVGAYDTVGLSVATGSGLLENVLIDHIGIDGFPSCALGLNVDGASANFGVNFVTGDFDGPICLATGPSYYVTNTFVIDNSIFWHSGAGLPVVSSLLNNGTANLYVQIRDTLLHAIYDEKGDPYTFYNQIDADPKWIAPATGSYDLGPGSPALDAGFPQSSLGLPSNDMIGQARFLGPNPDLGALESNGSTNPTYYVSNTADSGAGSLRQAIIDANANKLDEGDIVFQLPGGCPQVIALASPLPDIVSPVRILGYSQAGSAPNQDPDLFEPTLCVLLKPVSGTLTTALRVPASASAGMLDVSGLGFGGFGQPLLLLGGSPHRIAGNQFGGNANGVSLPGAGLNAISVGLGYIGKIQIGGPTPGERNMIGGATENGINIQASVAMDPDRCQIVNNLIGTNQNAQAAVPNGWGVNLAGSGCAVIGNRIAGNKNDALWINGGNNNLIQRNLIGSDADGNSLGIQNAYGIRVSGNNNVIGGAASASALSGSVNANSIRYMLKGGIVVEGGNGNSIRGNRAYDNGAGLPIDLGADGPSANDDGDVDTGPNQLQNYATISAMKWLNGYPDPAAQKVTVAFFGELKSASAGAYKLDAYFYNGSCGPGLRGQAEVYRGSFALQVAAGATNSVFNYQMQLPNVAAGAAVALTVTDSNGNTSELGECFSIANATLLGDGIFKNGYEP